MPLQIALYMTKTFISFLIMGLLSTKGNQQTNLGAIPKEMKQSLPPLYVFFC